MTSSAEVAKLERTDCIVAYLAEVESYFNVGLISTAHHVYEHTVEVAQFCVLDFELPPFPTEVSDEMERWYTQLRAARRVRRLAAKSVE